MVLRSLQTTLIGTSIRAESLASRWTWTVAPSVMEKSCWALTWRSLCGWITAPQQSVHVCDRLVVSPFLSSCTPSSFYLFLISQVFNLLTGSVNVIINGRESRVNPAQSFMVPCGENTFWIKAFSKLLNAVPAGYYRCIATLSCLFFWYSPSVHTAHAYSIQNVVAQPAVLYFTRIFAESSDWRWQLKLFL